MTNKMPTVTQTLSAYLDLGSAAKAIVDTALAQLDEREQQLVRLRFGHDRGGELRTLEEVGESLNVTRERAHQIEARAIAKLTHRSMPWPRPGAITWQQAAEVLLLHTERLMAQASDLERQLARALNDARLARARVQHLEDLTTVLRRELYATGDKADRRWVGRVATLVLGLVGGFLGGVGQAGGEDLLATLHDTEDASIVVIQECGLHVPADRDIRFEPVDGKPS